VVLVTVEGTAVTESGVLTASESDWSTARERFAVIAPLAAADVVGVVAAGEAAARLGISRRHVYTLINRCRQGSGVVSDLLPGRSSGGRGRSRLPVEVEDLLAELLRKVYLKRQKPSLAVVYRQISRACLQQGLPVPARNTVAARVAALHPGLVARSRRGPDAARAVQAAGGMPPVVDGLLERVQIDHTVVDVMVVDERDRQPIGRPYLTVAIDVYSRCLLGMVLTLEAPSAVSVGLCLVHVCCDKHVRLDTLGLADQVSWPMGGKPRQLYLDNAAEFKSEALRRGCEQHGIELDYRPPGRPHYGGIVERVIGTAMAMVHELPGTTFSNPAERGAYNPQATAVLTLVELERWLTLAVARYHGTVHAGLGQTPAGRWEQEVSLIGVPALAAHPTAFLVDFLPVVRRRLTRTGFVIDHVHYFSNALKPWIARRETLDKFVIRRDPRDISRIWVLDPHGGGYLEVPYRTLSHPAVTLWEQRQAVARLRERGRREVDETALFAMIDQMREIVDSARTRTRRTRRDGERRRHLPAPASTGVPMLPPDDDPVSAAPVSVTPFDDIEEW
jgi:putative transposase